MEWILILVALGCLWISGFCAGMIYRNWMIRREWDKLIADSKSKALNEVVKEQEDGR